MTCIAGIIEKDRVVIGGDSAGVAGLDVTIRKDPKVFRNGDFIFGCTSSFRMIQLLRFSFTPPDIGEKEIYEYMCTDFINAVRECFKEGGYLQKYTDGDEKGGAFLVGYKHRLFDIGSDFQVGEPMEDYACTGSGEKYALGALFASHGLLYVPAEDQIKLALEAASKFNGGVEPPFVIEST